MNSRVFTTFVFLLLSVFLVSCGDNTTPVYDDEPTQTNIEEQTESDVSVDETDATIDDDMSIQSSDMEISFIDSAWDGTTLPEGQHCSMFQGEGDSPEMLIENIPEGTRFIEIWYNDRTFAANDNGGHGKVAITVEEGATSVTVPSFAGESLDLPENMFVVEPASSSRANGGAYLPPCSGGAGNEYYISFFAYDEEYTEIQNLLGTGSIEMGIY